MRERITYIHPQGGAVDPKSLDIQDTALWGSTVEAIREDKFTISLGQLPAEVAASLHDLQELHLRWASPSNHDVLEPFSARLSPGIHVSYTPSAKGEHDPVKLCSLLRAFGPLDCSSPEAFTDMREGRQGNVPAFFFHQDLENLDNFAAKAAEVICTDADSQCKTRLESLQTATGLDVSLDSASDTVKFIATWQQISNHKISASAWPQGRTEVGILGRDVPPNLKPHYIGISGILTVIGQQKEPSTTLFSFPSRYRTADGSFSAKFLAPTGLHPALQLDVQTKRPGDDDDECNLYAYLTLPKTIFADRYQLADGLFLASKNLSATPYVSQPVDLEAPAYTTATWGSNVLVELARLAAAKDDAQTAEVPLHLRYLKPSQTGETEVEVPYPVVFWACETDTDIDFATNPFDRLHLGYDGLFSPSTVFWHVNPKPENGTRLMNSITVPVLADEASQWVGVGTAAVVGLGFMWVLWKLMGVYSTSGHGSVQEEEKKQGKKGGKKQK